MKRFLSLILAMLMVTALFVPSAAAEDNGMTFDNTSLHPLSMEFETAPMTFEAVIYIAEDIANNKGKGGTIFGNNVEGAVAEKKGLISFHSSRDYIRLTYINSETVKDTYVYFEIHPWEHLDNGRTSHLTVVRDDVNKQFRAYLNGKGPYNEKTGKYDEYYPGYSGSASTMSSTRELAVPQPCAYDSAEQDNITFFVGGDKNKLDNNFKHSISEIAVYKTARTTEQVLADADGIQYDEDMMAWFKLPSGTTTAPDLSGNGNHMGVQTGTTGTPTHGDYVTVKFNTGVDGMIVAPKVVVKGQDVTVSSLNRDGYVFMGWYNGDTKYESTFKPDADMTLTAKWGHTVTFEANGGAGTMEEITVLPGNYTLPACGFTAPAGKQFKAWLVGEDEKQPGDKITVSADTTVTAVWKDISAATYTVSFAANGGTGTMTAVSGISGDYTLPACGFTAPVGKQFKAWLVGEDEKQPGDKITVSTDTTVTAVWKDISAATYTVSFAANGGTGTMTAVSGISGDYTLPACGFTASAGKQFKAWLVGGVEKQPGDKITVSADTTVTADWKDIPVVTYTVSFAANGGTGTMTAVSGISGDYTLPACGFTASAGKQFKAWLVGGVEKQPGDKITVSADTTVTAAWEPKPAEICTVTFDTNGGYLESADPQTVTSGEKATNPGEPWKRGCTFLGWYNGNAEYFFETTPVTADLTLSAMWKVDSDNKGMSFSASEPYALDKDFDKAPKTIEARIYIPSGVAATGNNIIFSNNNPEKDNLIYLSLMKTCLQLTYMTTEGKAANVYFAVDPWKYRDQNIHIAVVRDDDEGEFRAYLTTENGKVETAVGTTTATSKVPVTLQTYNYSANSTAAKTFYVGGDKYVKGGVENPWRFKHYISEIVVYSDARDASEIAQDAVGNPEVNDDMLVWLQLSPSSNLFGAADLSLNNNHLAGYTVPEPKPEPKPDPTPSTKPSENPFVTPLFALVALYAQRYDVALIGENCSISGDTMIKYKRSGVVEITADEGYEIVNVILDGKELGAVSKVDIKKVTKIPELVVFTRPVDAGE